MSNNSNKGLPGASSLQTRHNGLQGASGPPAAADASGRGHREHQSQEEIRFRSFAERWVIERCSRYPASGSEVLEATHEDVLLARSAYNIINNVSIASFGRP